MVWHCSTLGGGRKRLKEERRALKQVRESRRLRCHLLFDVEICHPPPKNQVTSSPPTFEHCRSEESISRTFRTIANMYS